MNKKNNSFSIHFTILLANDSGIDSRKKAKNQSRNRYSDSFGIGIDTALFHTQSKLPRPFWRYRAELLSASQVA